MNIDFCTHCRKETEYTLQKRNIVRAVNGVEHTFSITIAMCNECGKEMNPHGLINKNIQEVEEQYGRHKPYAVLQL